MFQLLLFTFVWIFGDFALLIQKNLDYNLMDHDGLSIL